MRGRAVVLLFVLMIMLPALGPMVPSLVVPPSHQTTSGPRADPSQNFSTSADGDVSPDSITSFSETLPDDVMFYPDNESYGSGYVESFADVTDWYTNAWESEDSYSTDGDILSLESYGNANNDVDKLLSDSISISMYNYFEFRYRMNVSTGGADGVWIAFYDAAGALIRYWSTDSLTANKWVTVKRWIPTLSAGSSSSTTIEKVGLYTRTDVGEHARLDVDYVRVASGDQMGWQYDGSTLCGVEPASLANWQSTTEILSGDQFRVTAKKIAAGNSYFYVKFYTDTTSTIAEVDEDYYPFFKIRWAGDNLNDTSCWMYLYVYGQDKNPTWTEMMTAGLVHSVDFNETVVMNVDAIASEPNSRDYIATIYVYLDDNRINSVVQITVDYMKMYSIAEFSISQNYVEVDDIAYVQNGLLYTELDGYPESIIFNHDPAVSISPTYNVVNLTLADSDPTSSPYDYGVRVYQTTSTYLTKYEETRFDWTSSLTEVTDFFIESYYTNIISAIKFWQDSAAPEIIAVWNTPSEPDNATSVRFSVTAYDLMGVYSVSLVSLMQPAGSSISAITLSRYALGAGSELWTANETLSVPGEYVFEVRVSDGANVAYETLSLVVDQYEPATLVVSDSVFSYNNETNVLSGDVSIPCSYSVYENDSLTASGSLSAGSYSIEWPHSTTPGNYFWAVKFENGGHTMWRNGTYHIDGQIHDGDLYYALLYSYPLEVTDMSHFCARPEYSGYMFFLLWGDLDNVTTSITMEPYVYEGAMTGFYCEVYGVWSLLIPIDDATIHQFASSNVGNVFSNFTMKYNGRVVTPAITTFGGGWDHYTYEFFNTGSGQTGVIYLSDYFLAPKTFQYFVLDNGTFVDSNTIDYDIAVYHNYELSPYIGGWGRFLFRVRVNNQFAGWGVGVTWTDQDYNDGRQYLEVDLYGLNTDFLDTTCSIQLDLVWGIAFLANETFSFDEDGIATALTSLYTQPLLYVPGRLQIENRLALVAERYVTFSGTTNLPCNVTVTENGTVVATAEISQAGEFSLLWNRSVGNGDIIATLHFYTSTSDVYINVTYAMLREIEYVDYDQIWKIVQSEADRIIRQSPAGASPEAVQNIVSNAVVPIWAFIVVFGVFGLLLLWRFTDSIAERVAKMMRRSAGLRRSRG